MHTQRQHSLGHPHTPSLLLPPSPLSNRWGTNDCVLSYASLFIGLHIYAVSALLRPLPVSTTVRVRGRPARALALATPSPSPSSRNCHSHSLSIHDKLRFHSVSTPVPSRIRPHPLPEVNHLPNRSTLTCDCPPLAARTGPLVGATPVLALSDAPAPAAMGPIMGGNIGKRNVAGRSMKRPRGEEPPVE